MRCPRCNSEISDDSKFCPYCGTRIISPAEEERIRAMRNIRRLSINIVTNRIMLYVSFAVLIAILVSILLPIIVWPFNNTQVEVGGLSWFSGVGWDYLNSGQVAVGPFYTTFVLFIINLASTLALIVLAFNSLIRSLKKKEGFKASQYILLIFIINFIYEAVINAFYYEYYSVGTYYIGTSTGLGSYIFDFARFFWFVPFMFHLIFNGSLNDKKHMRFIIISSILTSYFTMMNYNDFLTSSGLVNYQESKAYIAGLMKYFDPNSLTYGMPNSVAYIVLAGFAFGFLALLSALFTFAYSVRSIYKKDAINASIFFILSLIHAGLVFGVLITSIGFGAVSDSIPGFNNYYIYLNSSLFAIVFMAILLVVFSSISLYKQNKEKTPRDPLDPEVVEKTEA